MALLDANEVAINVGDTVKLTGTVLSLDPAATHFGEVKIQLAHPLSGPPSYVPNKELAGMAPEIHCVSMYHPKAEQIITCAALTLTH